MARRPVNVFALSFLDCICCGFGAVILVFMIISAKIQEDSSEKLEGLESNRLRLESLESARARGAHILAEILGYAQVVEGHHLAQPDPTGKGIARAIKAAMESAGVSASDVGYINAHGTATPANDSAEARGILGAFGETEGRRVRVSSTKALVGHTLGGAGAVEQCFCILSALKGFVPLQANLSIPDPSAPLRFATAKSGPPGIMLNHSFGFGGVNGVVVSRGWEEGS